MLHRLTFLFILASTPLAGCNASEHCIGDCEPQSTSSDTAGPSPSSTSSTADGGTTTADAPTTTADAPTTGNTTTKADDLTTTGAEGQTTCRDGILCTIHCMINVPEPTPPDYPLAECLTSCLEQLSNAELLKLHDLQECAQTKCEATAEWKCVNGTDDCFGCVLQTLAGTMLPAGDECEAQAKACD